MPLVALVCASLLGLVDAATPSPDVAAEYQQIKARTSHHPADQVRLALWCEAHGLTAERVRHLALAVLADPTDATARGLAGLVARNGHWLAPDAVARAVQADAATSALLTRYDLRRSETPYTADAQWALGQWADEQGLKDQARAHYTAVTRLDPAREQAWLRLGYQRYAGRWETATQALTDREAAAARQRADRSWYPILLKCKTMLAHPAELAEAQATLKQLTDPHACPTIWSVFGHGSSEQQLVAVQLFGQIPGGAATLGLAELAVHGRSPAVLQAALDHLVTRDPRDCIESLVGQLHAPFKYQVHAVQGPGSVGELIVEGDQYNLRRVYTPPPGPTLPHHRSHHAGGTTWKPDPLSSLRLTSAASLERYMNAQIAAHNVRVARHALLENVHDIEVANAKIQEANDRVPVVLARITGLDLGPDARAWVEWNTERIGYAYRSASEPTEKPTYTKVRRLAYQDPVIVFQLQSPSPRGHTACFEAGTPVRTIRGAKPIEQIQPGDLVLVQDTTSGALSYQPVLTAPHNPPAATYRIKLAGDEIVATGIHRFWQAGQGWIMARDLKPGDRLRVLDGVAAVAAVSPEQVQPVFNLEVAQGRSFFVGSVGALVHDNSPVEATPHPFDAPQVGAAAVR